jgi:non-ribosomal peptide synthetase component E (peptide arylation enzyme)
MADHSRSIGFFAGEALAKIAERHPQKTAVIAKDTRLTFAALDQQVQMLASHLLGAKF